MKLIRRTMTTLASGLMLSGCAMLPFAGPDLSPANWPEGEYEAFMAAQDVDRRRAGAAKGMNGAVTVAYNGLAARAGLEALKQGGNAIDAALTAAMAQVALTAGAPISYFGILSLVYYDAATQKVHTMNAEWNTVLGEEDPLSIPGGFDFASAEGLRGRGQPSGRTAMVGGFMKGVESAHQRFGKLPFATLFEPSIYIAEQGMPVTRILAEQIAFRGEDLSRLPETRAIFTKSGGEHYMAGDLFRQPALANTLRAVARRGADFMYGGPWGEQLVAAIQADGGKMTRKDLTRYEVIWAEPQVANIANGYSVHTNPWPNAGGVNLIEAQNLAQAARLADDGHWTKSGIALRKALDITAQASLSFLPDQLVRQVYPNLDLSPSNRVTRTHAADMWRQMQAGAKLARYLPASPRHSDDVVAIDGQGNIAAITHSINTVYWGKTGIFVGGVSIGDPAAFQQAAIAQIKPGGRLPAPTQTGVLFRYGKPVLGFASMGSGLHQRTFQCLLNVTQFDMNVEQAINTPDFFMPAFDPRTYQQTVQVPAGEFDHEVLNATGYAWREIPFDQSRMGGEGKWVAISRNPVTGALHAASHNRNNSDALAY